ncbi:MAG: VWA-like domain-containing protein [Roseburia sp.]|nr:VWA-like domain-containing protein [Roseburia sp.]
MEENTRTEADKLKKAAALCGDIWRLARDRLVVSLRFLDAALAALSFESRYGLDGVACDGRTIYYDPIYVLRQYKKEPNSVARTLLHILFHLIFHHPYRYERMEQELWDAAADMAVENAIAELGLGGLELRDDDRRKAALAAWRGRVETLTAERIYRSLRENRLEAEELSGLSALFRRDGHTSWAAQETLELTQAQWKKISERVKAELKSFSQDKTDNRSIVQNLEEATRERYDYGDFLRRFCVAGEDMQINDDEFDYVYYTYGLNLYGNMPLVEPLEYKDVNKIKEFVIALDTSASCRGKLVQAFLNKTYAILKSSESFFRKVNIHILQCDSDVRRDTRITCDEDFDAFMKHGQLEGFGSTDFRPVFAYVNRCIGEGVFENLKGLLYFTDGYGVFPEQMPPYDTAFVFLDDGHEPPEIPPWAIKLVLTAEDIEEEGAQVEK